MASRPANLPSGPTDRSQYIVSNQISPIILVGGIAGAGGMLPIVNLLSSGNYDIGVLGTSSQQFLSGFFGQFRVLPNHTLMDNEVATYPVGNQATAANAVITQPLRVSLEMIAPAGNGISVSEKLAIMTALKSSLDDHTSQGGWYNVVTPSYIYTGCLLTTLIDNTESSDGGQVQVEWIWNFMQPLLTSAAAMAAASQATARIMNQNYNPGNPPGSQPITTGISSPASNIVQNLVPSSSSPSGSNVAPSTSSSGTPNLSAVSPITPGG